MNPDEIDVTEGDRVTLRLTSDAPVELHLHGYDLEAEVSPDEALGVLLVRPR
jgi:FtsP/CotA-like multicopper oxidase with cupredoxin domain